MNEIDESAEPGWQLPAGWIVERKARVAGRPVLQHPHKPTGRQVVTHIPISQVGQTYAG
jgi:hypothetical protein